MELKKKIQEKKRVRGELGKNWKRKKERGKIQ
jgi:hypothetical protein